MRRLTILGILACVVLLVVPVSVNAATQPPFIQGNVTVVNQTTQPVPVTGNVDVKVPNGVMVVNPLTSPIPVTNGPANTPLQVQLVTDPPLLPVASAVLVSSDLPFGTVYEVPPGAKKFVIEQVSYGLQSNDAEGFIVAEIRLTCSTNGYDINWRLNVSPAIRASTSVYYSGAQQVTLYADPGTQVIARVLEGLAGGHRWDGTVMLSGQLVY